MNKRRKRIFTFIIIIALIVSFGLAGYFVWKDITTAQQPETLKTITPETEEDKPALLKTASVDSTFPVAVSWEYPEDWTYASMGSGPTQPGDSTVQTLTMTSPSGDYSVIIRAGANGGLGGACDPTSGNTLLTLKKRPDALLENTTHLEFISEGEPSSNAYAYGSGLYKAAETSTVVVGSSFCDIYLRGIFEITEQEAMVLMSPRVIVNQLEQTSETTPNPLAKDAISVEEISALFETDEYDQAVAILLSLRTEQ